MVGDDYKNLKRSAAQRPWGMMLILLYLRPNQTHYNDITFEQGGRLQQPSIIISVSLFKVGNMNHRDAVRQGLLS